MKIKQEIGHSVIQSKTKKITIYWRQYIRTNYYLLEYSILNSRFLFNDTKYIEQIHLISTEDSNQQIAFIYKKYRSTDNCYLRKIAIKNRFYLQNIHWTDTCYLQRMTINKWFLFKKKRSFYRYLLPTKYSNQQNAFTYKRCHLTNTCYLQTVSINNS